MQCPIRKTQGKVRDGSLRCQLARPRYWTWYLILRCYVQWVLNLDCSCNGGKKKLQAPVHATRAGAVVKLERVWGKAKSAPRRTDARIVPHRRLPRAGAAACLLRV